MPQPRVTRAEIDRLSLLLARLLAEHRALLQRVERLEYALLLLASTERPHG